VSKYQESERVRKIFNLKFNLQSEICNLKLRPL